MTSLSHHRPARVATAAGAVLLALSGLGVACTREPERSEAAFCAQVRNVRSLDETLHGGDTAKIAAQVDELRTLQQVAPLEIEPKVALVIGFTDDFSRTLGTVKDPDEALHQVSERRAADVQSVIDAATVVASYTFDHCHITLGSEVPGTGTTMREATTTAPPPTGPNGKPVTTVKPKH